MAHSPPRRGLLGSVEAGKLAHLVIVKANPLENVGNVRHVEAVIHDGRLRRVAGLEQRERTKNGLGDATGGDD